MKHGEIGFKIRVLFLGGGDEHVLREKAVPGLFRDDPHFDPVVRIGTSVAVLHEHFLMLHVGQHAVAHRVEILGRDLVVDRAPPDVARVFSLIDDVLVLGRPTRVLAGCDDQPATGGQLAFAAAKRMFVQGWNRQVPMRADKIFQAVIFKPE